MNAAKIATTQVVTHKMLSTLRGHCRCGEVQLRLKDAPLFVHACHCLHCKQKTGSSFGLTCIVLEQDIDAYEGQLEIKQESPRTTAYTCASCDMPIYRTNIAFKATAWLQTRCLEDLRQLSIGAHIWVKRKDPWLELPSDVPQFDEGYHRDGVWPKASIKRVEELINRAT